jgi:menaquinone-dependent protoporphyrinogen oxidase
MNDMRVLVTVASRHGASTEIAGAIGDVLMRRGLEVSVLAPDTVHSVEGYDAVIVGSGIYAGRWLDPAKRFVERNRELFAHRPVWLFSSGPIGDPAKPLDDPVDAAAMIEATHARGHRVFAGRLDKADLSFPEKLIVKAVRAPEGDYRDWDEVRAWSEKIARELTGARVDVASA